MEKVRTLIEKALDEGYLMSLGTVDESGPWVADVIFVHDDDLNLYWISDLDTRHSQAVIDHPLVAASITVSDRPGTEFGLQLSGRASRIRGLHLPLAVQHWTKRGKPAPKKEEILYTNHSWYRFVPEAIELIYQPEYGFDKQVLTLS